LNDKQKAITDKEFDKFWISNYKYLAKSFPVFSIIRRYPKIYGQVLIRFDTCSKKERKQANRKCSMYNFDYIMEKKRDIWNFDHPVLDDFKAFLNLFKIP